LNSSSFRLEFRVLRTKLTGPRSAVRRAST
jgi:hypothetical protein